METSIDLKAVGKSLSSRFVLNYFAFHAVVEVLDSGTKVEGLKLQIQGKEVVNEQNFRQFLIGISTLKLDQDKLNPPQKKALDKIKAYLSKEKEPELPDTIQDERTMADIIAEATRRG